MITNSSELQDIELVEIPGGTFAMGAGANDRFANDTERPQHEVEVAAFRLGRCPVTVDQFRRYLPEHAEGDDPLWPVVNVSWQDAQSYCGWLSQRTEVTFRLPTESEWEYACRAGSTTAFCFGHDLRPEQANYLFDENGKRVGRGSRSAVGKFPANAFGVHDMHGNVCEWVEDAWSPTYASEGAEGNGALRDETLRVIRGGAWDYMPRLLRSSWRDRLPVTCKRDNVGFRVATSTLSTGGPALLS